MRYNFYLTDKAHTFYLEHTLTQSELSQQKYQAEQEILRNPNLEEQGISSLILYHPRLISEWTQRLLQQNPYPSDYTDTRPDYIKSTDQDQLTRHITNPTQFPNPLMPIWRSIEEERQTFYTTKGKRYRLRSFNLDQEHLDILISISDHFGIWGDYPDGVQYHFTTELLGESLFDSHDSLYLHSTRKKNSIRLIPSPIQKASYVLEAIGLTWLTPTLIPEAPKTWLRPRDKMQMLHYSKQDNIYTRKGNRSAYGKGKGPHNWNTHPSPDTDYKRGEAPTTSLYNQKSTPPNIFNTTNADTSQFIPRIPDIRPPKPPKKEKTKSNKRKYLHT